VIHTYFKKEKEREGDLVKDELCVWCCDACTILVYNCGDLACAVFVYVKDEQLLFLFM
jgi:hypothetical protein